MKKLFFTLLALCLCLNIFAQNKEKNVLLLHSYHQGLLWTDSVTSGITSVIDKYDNLKLYVEYLDAKRNVSEEFYNKLVELIRLRASNVRFDLVIASDNVALEFMLKYGDKFFPDIPVVFCGINNFTPQMIKGKDNYWGIIEKADHAKTLNSIIRLFPSRKKVLVINDQTVTGSAILKELKEVLPGFENKLEFEFLADFTIGSLKGKVKDLSDEYVIYLLVINRDANNEFISYRNGLRYVYESTKVPIFGSWDFYVGKGVVGGRITRGKEQGIRAGEISVNILSGNIEELESWVTPKNKYIFDYSQLEKFGVDFKNLPKESELINRNIQWEFYATVLLYFSIGLMVLILGLAVAVYLRRTQAIKLEGVVEDKTRELRDINEKLLSLNQQKNLFLGMAAHDLRNPISTIHSMSELLIDFNSAELSKEGISMLELIYTSSEYMLQLVDDLLDLSVIEMGKMVLKKEKVEYVSLLKKIVILNKNLAAKKNIEIIEDYRCEGGVELLLDKNKIIQVVNNLLNNAVKFSESGSSVIIHFECNDKEIVTSIIDKGKGIPEEELSKLFKEFSQTSVKTRDKQKGVGLGLAIARKIVEAHDGTVNVVSEYRVGSKFSFTIPITK